MGLFGWSRTPDKNGASDPTLLANDGISARSLGAALRVLMASLRRYADDQGGALVTGGAYNAYTVRTASGIPEFRAGLSLLVQANRGNTGQPTLNVDGLGPLPWLDANGEPMPAGRLAADTFYRVVSDYDRLAWRLEFVPIGDAQRDVPERNLLRNAAFTINTLGLSGSVTLGANAPAFDRWQAGAAGCAFNIDPLPNGDIALTIVSGSLVQIINGAAYLKQSGAYILNWQGGAQGRVYRSAVLTSGYGSAPIVEPDLIEGENYTVEFRQGTLSYPQFEIGQVPTAFDRSGDRVSSEILDASSLGRTLLTGTKQQAARALKTDSAVALPWYGGAPGGSDNGAAMSTARAETGTGDIIRLPGKKGDVYAFPTGFNMADRVIDPDPDIATSGVADFTSNGRVTRPLLVNRFQSGAIDQHWFVPDVYRLPAEKRHFLSPEAAENTSYSVINQTAAIYYNAPWSTDTVTPFTPTTTTADSATWTAPADWRGPIVPVRPGQEIGGVFGPTTDGGLSRAAYIQGTDGAAWIWGGTGGPLNISVKPRGSARSDTISGITWPELSNDPAWAPQNATWVIRPISHLAVEVLLNGVIVATINLGVNGIGVIQAAGLMTFGSGVNGTAGVAQMYRARRRHRRGQPNIKALLIGDSKTDKVFHANWPSWLSEWLDGTAGIRLTSIDNRAVSGETSAQQLARLQSVGNNGATDAVIYVGTNDVQYSFTAADTATNVGAIIDLLQAAQIVVTLVVPDLWYDKTKTPGAGWGYDTQNAEKGAATRAALIRLGAAKGVRVVDLQQVTGQVRATLAGTPGSFLRDNIHPSTFGSRIIARAIAEGMVAARCVMTTALPVRAAPTTWQQSGWTYNADNPLGFSISEDGLIQLGGTLVVNNAARADGTTILQLPEVYRPQRQYRCTAWADGNRPVLILIEATGAVTVFGVAAGGSTLWFEAPAWPLL